MVVGPRLPDWDCPPSSDSSSSLSSSEVSVRVTRDGGARPAGGEMSGFLPLNFFAVSVISLRWRSSSSGRKGYRRRWGGVVISPWEVFVPWEDAGIPEVGRGAEAVRTLFSWASVRESLLPPGDGPLLVWPFLSSTVPTKGNPYS